MVEVESFELNQGSQLAIQGASGTGKKVPFLNLIAGIVKPILESFGWERLSLEATFLSMQETGRELS